MKNYQCIIFFTLLQFTLGVHTSIPKGQTVMFPLPEFPLRKINSIEWKYHTINKTILLARINLNKQQHSKIFSKRTGMQIMENGTLHIEDIKDEDSGNYSCTIIFHDHKMQIEQIFLQVHNDLKTEPPNSTLYTATVKPSESGVPATALITILVCSALAVILIVATIFIFKCRKKCCCTSEEHIYANNTIIQGNKRSQVGRRMPDNKNR
ncbi:uncharacterized protein LOC125269503 [Megalobrama amblycephala]|uniref:uncharacterized protein LOC125269503 n=1 Tax=Megalobrama amblycephala TaxID=75352 RepID=UPI0020145108|nr:uncharacterized protein LOC125269503 [Megalobrama amblycephala]